MDVLRRRFGIDGSAQRWVAEFLSNRRQVVYAGKTESDNIALQFGVPQGSVLGPRVFVQYAEDVDDIFRRHEYITICSLTTCRVTAADDSTTFLQLSHGLKTALSTSTPGVAPNIYSSMPTRQSYCGLVQRRSCVSCHLRTVHVNQCAVKPVTVVRDLGVWFDTELSMHSHVSWVVQTSFYHLRRIRAVRRQLGRDVTAKLVTALVWTIATLCWPVFQLLY